jgi:hypothetical protein
VFLAERGQASRRGSLTLTGTVTHPTKGERPVSEVRAGDFVQLADRPDDPVRRIINTRYDHDTLQNVLDLDNTVFRTDAILERMGRRSTAPTRPCTGHHDGHRAGHRRRAGRPGLENSLHAEQPSAANVAAQDTAAPATTCPSSPRTPRRRSAAAVSRFVQQLQLAPRRRPEGRSRCTRPSAPTCPAGRRQRDRRLFDQPALAGELELRHRPRGPLRLHRARDRQGLDAGRRQPVVDQLRDHQPRRPARPNLIAGPGRKRLVSIIVDISKRWNIPLRRGAVSGCVPQRSGIIDHSTWGPCGGGHVDVTPNRNAIDPIISDARRLCAKRYRAAGHPVPGALRRRPSATKTGRGPFVRSGAD